MARSITDRTRNNVSPDQRLARRQAKQIGQRQRQQYADEVKHALKTWEGRRTGTTG
jgi:hypothetical protein